MVMSVFLYYVGNLDMPQSGSYHHENDALDTADESDVVSIKPPKSRSGNTFTVKKVCVSTELAPGAV